MRIVETIFTDKVVEHSDNFVGLKDRYVEETAPNLPTVEAANDRNREDLKYVPATLEDLSEVHIRG